VGRWRPLLGGSQGEAALQAVADIGEALKRRFEEAPPTSDPEDGVPDGSFAGGEAGRAVLFSYLAQAGVVDGAEETAVAMVDAAADAMAQEAMLPSLHAGYTGVGWAVTHLEGRVLDAGDEDAAAPVDEELLELLGTEDWQDDYDLISGLVGFGVYALERLPRPRARECLERVVDLLARTAERDGAAGTVTWHTRPELLPPWQRALCPDGYYNAGLAHGVPGAIGVLAGTLAAGVRVELARELLHGSVAWLLGLPPPEGTAFSSWYTSGTDQGASRAAWCYGDPGVAAALDLAGLAASEPRWRERALAVALDVARRSREACRVADVGICHGATGLAHVLNRLYQATGHEELGEAARSWFDTALGMRAEGAGIAGFTAMLPNASGGVTEQTDPSFLTGASGVALALLAAATDLEPEWDRVLLVSLRDTSL